MSGGREFIAGRSIIHAVRAVHDHVLVDTSRTPRHTDTQCGPPRVHRSLLALVHAITYDLVGHHHQLHGLHDCLSTQNDCDVRRSFSKCSCLPTNNRRHVTLGEVLTTRSIGVSGACKQTTRSTQRDVTVKANVWPTCTALRLLL